MPIQFLLAISLAALGLSVPAFLIVRFLDRRMQATTSPLETSRIASRMHMRRPVAQINTD